MLSRMSPKIAYSLLAVACCIALVQFASSSPVQEHLLSKRHSSAAAAAAAAADDYDYDSRSGLDDERSGDISDEANATTTTSTTTTTTTTTKAPTTTKLASIKPHHHHVHVHRKLDGDNKEAKESHGDSRGAAEVDKLLMEASTMVDDEMKKLTEGGGKNATTTKSPSGSRADAGIAELPTTPAQKIKVVHKSFDIDESKNKKKHKKHKQSANHPSSSTVAPKVTTSAAPSTTSTTSTSTTCAPTTTEKADSEGTSRNNFDDDDED